jgi:EpsI family protein
MQTLSYLRSTPALVVSLLLVGQIMAFHLLPTSEYVPTQAQLKSFQRTLGDWQMVSESEIDKETQELLKADDSMSRTYVDKDGVGLNLFVAFFKSQRAGVSPHSPKVCLPGSGWTPEDSQTLSVQVAAEQGPIEINRYAVSRGEYKSIVLYWYQTPHRVVASEYAAKLYLMADSLRYRRSDTWLVRVVSPVQNGDTQAAESRALRFIRSFYGPLKSYMPR